MMVEISKPDSKWYPYLAVLPAKLDSLMFWTTDELAELQACAVRSKIGKSEAENLYRNSIARMVSSAENIELFHLTASIIMAYAFDIPQDDESGEVYSVDELIEDNEEEKIALSMIPLADMLNADADKKNARLICDNKDLEMRAIRYINQGEEIFNDYGALPRSDLLRRYGYITDNYAKYDVVEVKSSSIIMALKNSLPHLSAMQFDSRLELAKREDVVEDSYDIGRLDSGTGHIPNELVALVYLMTLDDITVRSIQDSRMSLPSRSKMETNVVGQMIIQLLESRQKEYRTTLEEDEAILRAGGCPRRLEMAIHVRHGEKAILREAIKEADKFHAKDIRKKVESAKRARTSNLDESKKRNKFT